MATPPQPHSKNCDLQNLQLPCVVFEDNQLAALRKVSKVVADTGDINAIRQYKPFDATTNPSLILKAAQMPEYAELVQNAKLNKKAARDPLRPMAEVVDDLAVSFGANILDIIPGRVSTECDAHLAYDTQATVDKALSLMDLYAAKGVTDATDRVYIKIASTWEGIEACRILEKQGIKTNMTLLFSFAQAAACADAGAALISPFVGRIMDWYKAKEGREFASWEDPGVQSVKRIYKYYKSLNVPTIVMAASFRNVGEITELAGCDNITIAPKLLDELEQCHDPLPCKLNAKQWQEIETEGDLPSNLLHFNEASFSAMHLNDIMAAEKLIEGIDGFVKDQDTLEGILQA